MFLQICALDSTKSSSFAGSTSGIFVRLSTMLRTLERDKLDHFGCLGSVSHDQLKPFSTSSFFWTNHFILNNLHVLFVCMRKLKWLHNKLSILSTFVAFFLEYTSIHWEFNKRKTVFWIFMKTTMKRKPAAKGRTEWK